MTEIRLWKWEYTDRSGHRKTSKWLMTEREAIHYQDAIRLDHTLRVIYDSVKGRSSGSDAGRSIKADLAGRTAST